MSNNLQLAGSQNYKATRYTPIWVNRFFQGLWTNRSPLRDAGSSRIEEKFYGSRGDALIAGTNVELTPRLTLGRRPGLSVFNANTFPAVKRFHSHKYYTTTTNTSSVKVLADTASTIYDITTGSTSIFSKAAGAGQTSFLSLGNTLYFADGAETKKYLVPAKQWVANKVYNAFWDGIGATDADWIVDANGNIQQCTTPILSGDATPTPGTSGSVLPTWAVGVGGLTTDGTLQWTNRGAQVKGWGIPAPATAPGLARAVGSGTRMWSPAQPLTTPYALLDGNGNVQIALGNGTMGATYPSWNSSVGGQTTDGTVVWYNAGNPGSWTASTNYASYAAIVDPTGNLQIASKATGTQKGAADATGWIWGAQNLGTGSYTFTVIAYFADGTHTGPSHTFTTTGTHFGIQWNPVPGVDHYQVFCTTATPGGASATVTGTGAIHGTGSKSAGSGPSFAPGVTKLWLDNGSWYPYAGDGTTAPVANTTNTVSGTYQESGTSMPNFATVTGSTTTDGNGTQPGITWTCYGSAQLCVYQGYEWVYAYHTVDGHVGTASPVQQTGAVGGASFVATISGVGYALSECDTIWIFRTVDGGSSFLYLGYVQNPGAGVTWSFTDAVKDADLNEFLSAPIAHANDQPTVTSLAPVYHLGRVFVADGVYVRYSQSYNTVGAAEQSFPPLNYFQFPSRVIRMVTTTNGLLVYTVGSTWLIFGLGLSGSPFQVMIYDPTLGLSSYNELSVEGNAHYLISTDGRYVAFTPGSSGLNEFGQPIADVIATGYTPGTNYVTAHISGSMDHAVYMANASGWYRFSLGSPPDNNPAWSTHAVITGGCAAVQSIETAPGVKQLLVSPAAGGPILKRDLTVYSDNGSAYAANFTLGSLVLAQPGQLAEVDHITTEEVNVSGTTLTVGVLLDEALPYYGGAFTSLTNTVSDPPELVPSTSILANRFYVSQSQTPGWCRHMQIQINWATEAKANELLSLAVFGAFWQSR